MNTARVLAAAAALLLCAPVARAQEDPADLQEMMQKAFEEMTEANKQLQSGAREQGMAGYDRACALYERVLDELSVAGLPDEAVAELTQIAHYNIACARSLQGRTEAALAALEKAIDAGWTDLEHMAQDTDLDPIRGSDGYKRLVAKVGELQVAAAQEAAREAISEGKRFDYDLDVTTIDGKRVKLSDLRGKVVIVDYWGTWCPPCRKEIPHFVALHKQFGDRLAIVGLAWEHGEGGEATVAKVRAFAKEQGIDYPLALVTSEQELRKVPGFNAFPTTLFIDKAGQVRAMEVGYRDQAFLTAVVKALDAEQVVQPAQPERPAQPAPPQGKQGDDWF